MQQEVKPPLGSVSFSGRKERILLLVCIVHLAGNDIQIRCRQQHIPTVQSAQLTFNPSDFVTEQVFLSKQRRHQDSDVPHP